MSSKDIFVQHSSREGSTTEIPELQSQTSLARQGGSFQIELNPSGRLILLAELVGRIPALMRDIFPKHFKYSPTFEL